MNDDEKEMRGCIAHPDANLERFAKYAPMATEKMPRFDTPVYLLCTSYRKRLADTDGISYKAFIDGIVKAGILEDDSAKFVKEIRYKQFKTTGEEKTVIEIIEV